jgi:hypothetical protein
MGTKFKCNQSGNIFEFFSDHDINTMRKHPEYSEVRNAEKVLESNPVVEEKNITIKRSIKKDKQHHETSVSRNELNSRN